MVLVRLLRGKIRCQSSSQSRLNCVSTISTLSCGIEMLFAHNHCFPIFSSQITSLRELSSQTDLGNVVRREHSLISNSLNFFSCPTSSGSSLSPSQNEMSRHSNSRSFTIDGGSSFRPGKADKLSILTELIVPSSYGNF